jgi:hypothetical protein
VFFLKVIEWIVKRFEGETEWDRIQREKREREREREKRGRD